MKQAGEEESRDEDDEDEDGGVVCEVEMGVEGEAEGSVVETEKNNERKDRPHTGEEIQKNERVKQKCFKERRLRGKELNSVAYSQLKSIPSMDF